MKIDIAKKYENELKLKFADIMFNMKYKYADVSCYRDEYKASDTTWDGHEFVVLDKNEIIGYVRYSVNRNVNYAHGLQIINFSNNKITFGLGVNRIIQDIFYKFNFNKLDFCVVVGNPIEKTYDKIVNKYKGRIVGIFKDDTKLIDNKIYDVKHYEILKKDIASRNDYEEE